MQVAAVTEGIGNAVGGVAQGAASIIQALYAHRGAEAEAEAKKEAARAEADAKIKAEETLQKQNELASKERLKELEMKHKKQEMELAAKREKEKLEHQQKMEKLKQDKEQKDKEFKKQQRDESVITLTNDIEEMKERINKLNDNLHKNAEDKNDKQSKVNILNEKIKDYFKCKEDKLNKFSISIGLDDAESAYDRVKAEIKAVIDGTRVHESTVTEFLKLLVNLVDVTKDNQENANYLSGELKTFGDLVERLGSGKLTILQYCSSTPLENYVKYLKNEGYENMEDLICDGSDAEEEYDEIVDIVAKAIEYEYKEWENEKKEFEDNNDNNGDIFDKPKPTTNKIKRSHTKLLKKACKKPETWEKESKEKEQITKDKLGDISPVMAIFFNKIGTTAKQARLILSYNSNNKFRLTQEQQNAIKNSINLKRQLSRPIEKAITLGKENKKENEDENDINIDDNKNTEDNQDSKKLEISTINDNETNDDNKDNNNNNNNNDLSNIILFDKLNKSDKDKFVQSMALGETAILSINVLDSMIDEFTNGSGFRTIAKSVAMGVESGCMQLITNIAQIRQSILLAHCILNMKPGNLDGKSLELWNAVDDGIVQIYKNAIIISQVAAEFFGYLNKFEQSFLYYNETKDKSLMISTEYLRKDIKEFNKFSLEFNLHVNKLGKSALTCIGNCVKNMKGAENYEKNQNDLELKKKEYVTKKKEYDLKSLELKRECEQWIEEREQLEAECKTLEFLQSSMTAQLKHDEDLLKSTQQLKNELQSLLIE